MSETDLGSVPTSSEIGELLEGLAEFRSQCEAAVHGEGAFYEYGYSILGKDGNLLGEGKTFDYFKDPPAEYEKIEDKIIVRENIRKRGKIFAKSMRDYPLDGFAAWLVSKEPAD